MQNDKLQLLASEGLKKSSSIQGGFFTREGGVSEGIYKGLNCGLGSDDNREAVVENQTRAAKHLSCSHDHLLTLHQIHSSDCVVVDERWHYLKRPKADSIVTNKKDIILGILTADCVPVLFYDEDNHVIGAAHAGWKGAIGGVLQETVHKMVDLNAKPSSIQALVGPCIAYDSYEVGQEFYDQFILSDNTHIQLFKKSEKPGHYYFNLREFIVLTLSNIGLMSVNHVFEDTYQEKDRFYSYRRSQHLNEPDYGRTLSAIVLS